MKSKELNDAVKIAEAHLNYDRVVSKPQLKLLCKAFTFLVNEQITKEKAFAYTAGQETMREAVAKYYEAKAAEQRERDDSGFPLLFDGIAETVRAMPVKPI